MATRFCSRTLMPWILLCVAFGVLVLSFALELPIEMVVCLSSLSTSACVVGFQRKGRRWQAYLGWAATIAATLYAIALETSLLAYGGFFLALAVGIAVLLAGAAMSLPRGDIRLHWHLLASTWTLFVLLFWLGTTYLLNATVPFFFGLLATLLVLIAIKCICPLPRLLVLAFNTGILLVVGLPVADYLTRPSYQLPEKPDLRKRLYAYQEARRDPTAFARWWDYFVREWRKTQKDICMAATNGMAPFRLRPGSDGKMFESHIHINRLGFRGPEISADKGSAYRIVTLGESTTFGHTMYADDVPWPQLLEQMATHGSGLSRPVQVINAGIPSYDLHLNIERLRRKILGLKPDMIISYHGYNGFNWLVPELPPVFAKPPPPYEARPLKLLADAEYRLKVMSYRRQLARLSAVTALQNRTPGDNPYDRGYRELIQIARTNHIRLVLANYSMAVNEKSDLDVIAFYRAGFPDVINQIKANELHSRLVARLTTDNPDVYFVDTHPALDGLHENFIDLVHFTQPGRQLMAETMFSTIRPVLEKDLGQPGQNGKTPRRTPPGDG